MDLAPAPKCGGRPSPARLGDDAGEIEGSPPKHIEWIFETLTAYTYRL
jgi:hypothetical protein